MSMTLGRFSTTEDPEAGSLRQSGDRVEFESMIVGTSTADMQAKVQQLRGLVDNPDESVFPFTWSEDSTFDGFYTDVEVDVEDTPAMYAAWNVPFTVRMRRVSGYGRPRVEFMVTRTLRTNSHAVTAPESLAVVLANANDTDLETDWPNDFGTPANGASFPASGVTSDLTAYTFAWSASTKTYRTTRTPAQFYQGAASVEFSYGGTYYATHGEQVPAEASTSWRVSNGLTRAYPVYNTGRGYSALEVETWDGSGWAGTTFAFIDGAIGATSYRGLFGSGTGAGQTKYAHCRVLRNDPAMVVIRMDYAFYSTTISLTYGQPWVVVSIIENVTTAAVKHGWRAIAAGTPASATLTGGIKATASDSNGRKFLVTSPSTVSASVPSVWATTAAKTSTWQLCADWDSGWDLTTGTGTGLRDYFLGNTAVDQKVVIR